MLGILYAQAYYVTRYWYWYWYWYWGTGTIVSIGRYDLQCDKSDVFIKHSTVYTTQ